MPAPGGSPGGMGGMSPPGGGEVPEEMAQMMGAMGKSSSGSQNASSQQQQAAAQQVQDLMGGGDAQNMDMAQAQQASKNPPREVGTVAEEMKRGVSDIFQGIKEFFKLNTWLGINSETMDPQEQAHAKQLHSRYQQLDQEQQMVARQMFEEKMKKKQMEEEEALRKQQIEEQQRAQSIEMPSGPQKGPVGPGSGQSKKQNAMQKLKQDRTTLNNVQGE